MSPYVVGLIGNYVEVRSLKSGAVVQKIELDDARIIFSSSFLYIASYSSIEQLISTSRFIEAQRLIEELDFTTEDEKTANIIRVRGLYAHHLFTYDKKYEEAVSMLAELKASPVDVINLYPQFSLIGAGGEPVNDRPALQTLLDYLTNQRTILSKLRDFQASAGLTRKQPYDSSNGSANGSIWSGSADGYPDGYNMRFPSLDDTLYLSEVVDTTLLKVYLAVNHALVGPLVRIKNFCNLAECEEILLANKVSVKVHQEILDYLESISASLESRYLEYMIDELKNEAPEFHDRLILNYLQTLVRNLVASGGDEFHEEKAIILGRLGRHRDALLIFVKILRDLRSAEM
ncbi:Vam6/Vps39-like protein [Phlyctochytrium bullatum]|nr:Vam6/Vps39-like protein [Phlyctochytrium bullatum]